jgi:hypothetical protein
MLQLLKLHVALVSRRTGSTQDIKLHLRCLGAHSERPMRYDSIAILDPQSIHASKLDKCCTFDECIEVMISILQHLMTASAGNKIGVPAQIVCAADSSEIGLVKRHVPLETLHCLIGAGPHV